MLNHSIHYDKKSSFSIFINHKDTFRGISDYDRALTSKSFASIFEESLKLSKSEAQEKLSQNFRIPGHVPVCIADPNLLKARQGHTELVVALFKFLGINPIALGCEMIDSITLQSTDSLIISFNNYTSSLSCYGELTAITANISGGTTASGNYNILWDNGDTINQTILGGGTHQILVSVLVQFFLYLHSSYVLENIFYKSESHLH